MNKYMHKKIFLIVFLISILVLFYAELKSNLNEMKMEYMKNQAIEIQTSVQESGNNKINDFSMEHIGAGEKLLHQNEQKDSIGYWKPIERQNSYNNELQFYSIENVVIKGDSIEITSKQETRENKMYTSGMVESTNVYKYGYFEFIIKVSKGQGIFPAIWFLPNDGYALPEIDLFEMVGNEPYIFYGVLHFEEDDIQSSYHFAYEVPIKEQYSVALEWTPESLTWYIDNKEIYTTKQQVPQEYMYIIINQAIGGNWPGNPDDTIFPNQFKILSVNIDPVLKKGRD